MVYELSISITRLVIYSIVITYLLFIENTILYKKKYESQNSNFNIRCYQLIKVLSSFLPNNVIIILRI